MKWKNIPRLPLVQTCAAAVVAGSLGAYAPTLLAATAAGTQIKNLATVTYEDASGNVYSAQSNEAIVTVAQIYTASIGVDVNATASAGQTVYLPFVLTNTGNGTDTYDLSGVNGITGGDSIDSGNITVYHDVNGNGVPDAGELVVSSLVLSANVNNIANLVVAVEVPSSATDGQTLGVTFTAEAHNGTGSAIASSVTDLSAGGGLDTLDGTNESLITVPGDAVLVTTKSSVHDTVNNQISYTVSVRNNGNSPASNVVIYDGLPAGTTLLSSGVSGLLNGNGDTLDTAAVLDETTLSLDLNADGDIVDVNEATLGIDLNTNGNAAETIAIDGVYAIDAVLPPNTSVSLTFTVSYDPAVLGGGYVIENVGFAAGDTDGDGTADTLAPSNTRQDVINPAFGVTISDTGAGAAAGVNDGGDDDAAANDDQFVDEIAVAGTVQFTSVIANTGNSDDIFELTVNTGNFPVGTVFVFYDSSGVVQLGDTNGSGVDSGVIAGGATKTIIVKAVLPASVSGNAPLPATEYQATVQAVSASDPAASPASDTTDLSLGTIITATADIHNATGGSIGADENPLNITPFTAIDTFNGTTGTSISIPLYIDNEGGGADSYVLTSGSSWDGTVLGALPAGWSVQYFLGDGAGNAIGAAITSTPVIPGSQVDFEIVAVVNIPNDATQAISDVNYDIDGDTIADTLDGNADGDGDYPVFFQITSSSTGATDITLDAVDVDATRQLSLITPSSNQLEPGGTVAYGHTLTNSGNVNEVIELNASNSLAGWSNTLSIDTDGDGVADTLLGNLAVGVITVQQASGVDITVTVSDTDADNIFELVLEPSFSIPLSVTVFAPANASPGSTDVLTILATNIDVNPGAPSASLDDQTTVISGQVRLVKTVALDADCDGLALSAFEQVQSASVEPGQCVVWRVVAENQGSADASNVTITDSIPAYSAFEAGSLQYCLGNACTPATVTDAAGDDSGNIVGSNIVYYVGTSANPSAGTGGVLVAGQQATAQFRVKVQ